jgi:hypothetical protein
VVDGGHDLGGGVSDRAALAAGLAAQALEGLPLAEAAAGGQGAVGPLDHRPGVQRPLELVGQRTPGDHGRTAAKEHRHYPGRGHPERPASLVRPRHRERQHRSQASSMLHLTSRGLGVAAGFLPVASG